MRSHLVVVNSGAEEGLAEASFSNHFTRVVLFHAVVRFFACGTQSDGLLTPCEPTTMVNGSKHEEGGQLRWLWVRPNL